MDLVPATKNLKGGNNMDSHLAHISLITCLVIGISGCASPGPSVTSDPLGNIVVNGIPNGISCVKVTVRRAGMSDVEFPTPGPGLPVAPVNGSTVTIPATQSSSPITITGITVTIPADCGRLSGTWNYTGGAFQLTQDRNHLVRWSDFTRQ